jgi:hypothetical protein
VLRRIERGNKVKNGFNSQTQVIDQQVHQHDQQLFRGHPDATQEVMNRVLDDVENN